MNIDTPTIRRLRDALICGGDAEESKQVAQGRTASGPAMEASIKRVAPFVETMFLVMSVDGEHSEEEKAVILGAIRTLTRGLLNEASLQELMDNCALLLESQGFEARLQAIGSIICANRQDRETGFTLAAVVALADNEVQAQESDLLVSIAEWFGLSTRRSREILQQFDP